MIPSMHNGGSFFQQFIANNNDHHHHDDDGPQLIEDEPEEVWEKTDLPSRKRARDVLGEPACRSKCFGCVYELSTEAVQIPSQTFKELILLASKCVCQMSLESL